MKEANIRYDLSGIGGHSSIVFSRKLRESGLLDSPCIRTAEISFQGLGQADYLRLEDLATLTILIRSLAVSGIHVTVQWPRSYRGHSSRMEKVLEGLRFANLFDPVYIQSDWVKRIVIRGRHQGIRRQSGDPATAHYLPMRWFDQKTFDFDSSMDIWGVRPRLLGSLEMGFRETLHLQGFADDDVIDILSQVMFTELGWNVVLHSNPEAGKGVGIFCGQIVHPSQQNKLDKPILTFCLADLGRGIPKALGAVYETWHEPNRRYHEVYQKSLSTGIVRFALDPDTSSRPKHISRVDAEGYRGLAYVSEAIQGCGEILLRSDGGMVKVVGRQTGAEAQLIDDLAEHPLPGAQVIGFLRSQKPMHKILVSGEKEALSNLPPVFRVADFSGQAGDLQTDAAVRSWLNSLPKPSAPVLVFDLGCSETPPRNLEYLCKEATTYFPGRVLILWNLRTDWNVLKGLMAWIGTKAAEGNRHIIIGVKSCNDVRLLASGQCVEELQKEALKRCPWISLNDAGGEYEDRKENNPLTLCISPGNYLRMSIHLNSFMLKEGFAQRRENEGYFVGRVHLLSGETVLRYFSFTLNTSGKYANNDRWCRTALCALDYILENSPRPGNGVVILGFAGCVLGIVRRLWETTRGSARAYTLLTYDVPSVEEVRTVVHSGDRVVLVTDVISTGSLVSAVGDLVHRAGGEVLGLIAMVDSRRDPAFGAKTMKVANKDIPVIACAQTEPGRSEGEPEEQLMFDEFWLDPVSFIPVRKLPDTWELPKDVLDRIDFTINAICESNSAKCGHCVDGARHMSTYIDIQKMLTYGGEMFSNNLAERIRTTLRERKWDNFSPTHVVFPSGIERLERVGMKGENIDANAEERVTVYQTAVRTYVACLKKLWPNVQEVEILRTFDPGGNSRCATAVAGVDQTYHPSDDIVIADDGIWTGRTITSLLRNAVDNGALRVLIVPLLSRLRATETVHWESLRSVWSRKCEKDVPVCIFFPLLFPVPSYGAQDCPYEMTIRRMRDRTRQEPVLRAIADRLREEFEGKTPRDMPARSSAFAESWLKLRCYIEMASESESALAKALDRVQGTKDQEGIIAIFRLLTEEWPIASRARIRQALTPVARKRAASHVIQRDIPLSLRLASEAFLRSLYPNEYIRVLGALSDAAYTHIDALERSILHVGTLDHDLRVSEETTQFLRRICGHNGMGFQRGASPGSQEIADRYSTVLAYGRRMLFSKDRDTGRTTVPTEPSQISSTRHLCFLIDENIDAQHELRPTLKTLDVGRNNLSQCSQEVWLSYCRKWENILEPVLTQGFLYHIDQLHDVLIRAGTPKYTFVGPDLNYLVSAKDSTTRLADDISMISVCLQLLSQGGYPRGVGIAGDAAARVWRAICGERRAFQNAMSRGSAAQASELSGLCTLGRILADLYTITISTFINHLKNDITGALAHLSPKVPVDVFPSDYSDLEEHIFLPPSLVTEAIAQITSNLITWAFPVGYPVPNTARVGIFLDIQTGSDGDVILNVRIKDKGCASKDFGRQGTAGRQMNSQMTIFGGAFPEPRQATEARWSGEQEMSIKVWGEGGKYEDPCSR